MPITLNGTTGASFPDGSAGTPAEKGSTSSTAGIFYPAANTVAISTNSTEALRVDSSQNVGIGVTPSYKLDVLGPIAIRRSTVSARISTLSNENGNFEITADSVYNMVFITGGTERARIDASGNLLVGTTSQGGSYNGRFVTSTGAGLNGILVKDTQANGAIASFVNSSNAQAGTITISGTTTTYGTSSDISLKENITSAFSSLASILALPIRQFDWREDGSHTDYGVVAQEAYEYAPEMVAKGDIWQVDYGRITPRLIKAIQELSAKLDAAEARIAALEAK